MKRIIFMIGLFWALGINPIMADDTIDYYVDSEWALTDNLIITVDGTIDTWDENYGIYAEFSTFWIQNSGTVFSLDNIGIFADEMTGDITNYASGHITGYDEGIGAWTFYGNIYNSGEIVSTSIDGISAGIMAQLMEGDIHNYVGGIIYSQSGYGIYAEDMSGDINNSGTIEGDLYGIDSSNMTGSIYNYVDAIIVGEEYGIYAVGMSGSIYNYGNIDGDDEVGIDAYQMSGDIYNYSGGYIQNYEGFAINAEAMTGSIYNYDIITSYYGDAIYAEDMEGSIYNYDSISSSYGDAIDAETMEGSIYNFGTIASFYGGGINAFGMTGDIYNYEGALIRSREDEALSLIDFTGTLYNYGTIQGSDGVAIYGTGTLNIIGNGTIIGQIYDDGVSGTLNLSNDIDGTILKLNNTGLIYWETINLLQGEMIIDYVYSGGYITVNQTGDDTYIHMGDVFYGIIYNLDAGTFNPYHEASAFQTLDFEGFYASAGSTIEIDFGYEGVSDKISAAGDGDIEAGTIVRLLPNETFDIGFEDTYTIFRWMTAGQLILEIPLLYTAEGEYEELFYDVTITRKDESYSKYATTYNKGFANFIDNIDGVDAEKLQLSLEQAYNVDDFNALLEPYNMVGYASLANNNVNYINIRTNKLFNILSSGGGTDTTASNTPIGSSYATANPGVKRDSNGNNIWFNVYMNDSSLDGEDGYELESDGYEVAVGIDKEISADMILGLALHYNDYNSNVTGALPVDVDTEGLGLSLYGQYKQDKLTHKAIIGYTDYSNDASRAGADADFDNTEFYIAYHLEYLLKKESYDIIPIAGLTYSHITYDDIVEDGGVTGLEGYDYDSLQSELGVKLVKQLNSLGLNVGVSWIHELMDTESDATATSDLGSYDQDGIERDEDIFRLSIGLDYQLTDKVNLSLDYAKEFGSNTDSDSIEAKVSFSF